MLHLIAHTFTSTHTNNISRKHKQNIPMSNCQCTIDGDDSYDSVRNYCPYACSYRLYRHHFGQLAVRRHSRCRCAHAAPTMERPQHRHINHLHLHSRPMYGIKSRAKHTKHGLINKYCNQIDGTRAQNFPRCDQIRNVIKTKTLAFTLIGPKPWSISSEYKSISAPSAIFLQAVNLLLLFQIGVSSHTLHTHTARTVHIHTGRSATTAKTHRN